MDTVCIAQQALIGSIIYIAVAYIFALVIGWIDGDCMEGIAFTMCLIWPLSIPIYTLIRIGECLFKFYEKHGGIKKVLFLLFLPLRPIKIGSLLSDSFSKWRKGRRRSIALRDPVIERNGVDGESVAVTEDGCTLKTLVDRIRNSCNCDGWLEMVLRSYADQIEDIARHVYNSVDSVVCGNDDVRRIMDNTIGDYHE